MSEQLSLAEARDLVRRLRESVSRKECWSCDCLQGLLTQLELDYPELGELVEPLKISHQQMHGCLGCATCLPGELFAQYLQRQKESTSIPEDVEEAPSQDSRKCRG